MKLNTKKILVTLILVVMCFAFTMPVFAADYLNPTADRYKGTGSNAADAVGNASQAIYGIVQIVAMTIAIIMLIIIGIKYVSAAPEGKAELKKKAIIYIIGAMLLFGATAIVGLLKNISTETFDTRTPDQIRVDNDRKAREDGAF